MTMPLIYSRHKYINKLFALKAKLGPQLLITRTVVSGRDTNIDIRKKERKTGMQHLTQRVYHVLSDLGTNSRVTKGKYLFRKK
jgi:hypothetical protein